MDDGTHWIALDGRPGLRPQHSASLGEDSDELEHGSCISQLEPAIEQGLRPDAPRASSSFSSFCLESTCEPGRWLQSQVQSSLSEVISAVGVAVISG